MKPSRPPEVDAFASTRTAYAPALRCAASRRPSAGAPDRTLRPWRVGSGCRHWQQPARAGQPCASCTVRVGDVVLGGTVRLRTSVIQQKTGRPVPFELTDPTREALTAWLRRRPGGKATGSFRAIVDQAIT